MHKSLWISILTVAAAVLIFAVWNARAGAPSGEQPYGAKVKFREGAPVQFKDFEVIYLGKRRVVPKQYPRGWWAYDFIIRSGESEQKVTWSAGTGSIDPARFDVKKKTYQLELGMADKLGQLAEDEMVVSAAR